MIGLLTIRTTGVDKKIRIMLQGSLVEPNEREGLTLSQKAKKILSNKVHVGQISYEASQLHGLALVVLRAHVGEG